MRLIILLTALCLCATACSHDVSDSSKLSESPAYTEPAMLYTPTAEASSDDMPTENSVVSSHMDEEKSREIGFVDLSGDGMEERVVLKEPCELVIFLGEKEICRTDISISVTGRGVHLEIIQDIDGISYIHSRYSNHVGGNFVFDENGDPPQTPEDIVGCITNADTYYEEYYQLVGSELILVDQISYAYQYIQYWKEDRPDEDVFFPLEANGVAVDRDSTLLNTIFEKYGTEYPI